MILSYKKQTKKHHRYRTHHEIYIGEEDELAIVGIILTVIVGVWWAIVHVVDMFFNKLSWWMEPLTIIPLLAVGGPALWIS